MNIIFISGTITTAPQLRYTSNNQTPLCEIMVEVPPTKDGDPAEIVKVIGWGKKAQEFAETLGIGESVLVEGTTQINTIDRPEGFKEKRVEINASSIQVCDCKINTVILVGRVGRDVETKFFESGKVKSVLGLAVKRPTKADQVDWMDCDLWNKTAETASNYVRKGSLIGVHGSLKFDHWQDRNTGASRSKPIINVDRLELLGSKSDSEGSQGSGYPTSQAVVNNAPATRQAYDDSPISRPAAKPTAPAENFDSIPF